MWQIILFNGFRALALKKGDAEGVDNHATRRDVYLKDHPATTLVICSSTRESLQDHKLLCNQIEITNVPSVLPRVLLVNGCAGVWISWSAPHISTSLGPFRILILIQGGRGTKLSSCCFFTVSSY